MKNLTETDTCFGFYGNGAHGHRCGDATKIGFIGPY